MSRERDVTSPAAERAREAVGLLHEPAPDPDFRERLRVQFMNGTLAPAAGAGTAWPVAAPSRRPWLARPVSWVVAAAAAAFVVVIGLRLNAGPAWQLDSVAGDGIATVDGRPIPLGHTAELAAALTPGARVRIPAGGQIAIRSPGVLAVQMTPETDATVPPVPGRWFGRAVAAEITSGEWRIMTGPRFHGAAFAIATPAAHVEITGTTIAVICEPEGTCVCVYEGRARVGRDRSDMVGVAAGHRRYVYNDATRAPAMDVIRPTEAAALPEFRARMKGAMGER